MTRSQAMKILKDHGSNWVVWKRNGFFYLGFRRFNYRGKGSQRKNQVSAVSAYGYHDLIDDYFGRLS